VPVVTAKPTSTGASLPATSKIIELPVQRNLHLSSLMTVTAATDIKQQQQQQPLQMRLHR